MNFTKAYQIAWSLSLKFLALARSDMKSWMVSISFEVPASMPRESWNTNPGLLLKTNASLILWTPRWRIMSSDPMEMSTFYTLLRMGQPEAIKELHSRWDITLKETLTLPSADCAMHLRMVVFPAFGLPMTSARNRPILSRIALGSIAELCQSDEIQNTPQWGEVEYSLARYLEWLSRGKRTSRIQRPMLFKLRNICLNDPKRLLHAIRIWV